GRCGHAPSRAARRPLPASSAGCAASSSGWRGVAAGRSSGPRSAAPRRAAGSSPITSPTTLPWVSACRPSPQYTDSPSCSPHPHRHPADRFSHFEPTFLPGLRRCSHLLAISEFGKSEIVRHLGWPADRVTVTYMGVRRGLGRVEGRELGEGLHALGLRPGYLL